MGSAVNGSIEEFLNVCGQSGDAAYGVFRSLLERLEDPKSRKDARMFLSDLQKRFDTREASEKCLQTYHFRIEDIYLEQNDGAVGKTWEAKNEMRTLRKEAEDIISSFIQASGSDAYKRCCLHLYIYA